MKKTRRTSKVGEMIRDTLVQVFRSDLKDVDLAMISITSVEVSPDLHFARVYLSGLKEDETKATVKELQKARATIRYSLGRRIHLRYTPELDFKYDETTVRASRIEALLLQHAPKKAEAANDDGSEGEDTRATQNDDDNES